MSGEKTLEELEIKERHRLLSVSRRKSALVAPEEQQEIIDRICRHFTGILQDKTAVPTIEQVVSYLEKTYNITRDPKARHVSVPAHTDQNKMEEAVYAGVLILMATEASNLVSPSGGSSKELFVLATALLASNVAIAQEQIATVMAALEAGKDNLSPEDQANLAVVITLSKLNSELITQSNLEGKHLSAEERERALKEAISTGDSFPDAAAKTQAMDLLEKYDAKFQAIANKLAEPLPASLAATASSGDPAATVGVTTAASSTSATTAIVEDKHETVAAMPGSNASGAVKAEKGKEAAEPARKRPSTSTGDQQPRLPFSLPAARARSLSDPSHLASRDKPRTPDEPPPTASFS